MPSPAMAAQQARNDPATAMAVMQAHPFEVEQIAMQFKVPRATAAMMLLAQMTAQPMPAMAQGGSPNPGEPVLVGERGPEVFVPDVPGRIVPTDVEREWAQRPHGTMVGDLGYNDIPLPGHGGPWKWEYGWTFSDTHLPEDRSDLFRGSADVIAPLVKPTAWDSWFSALPESQNIENRRTPEQIAQENLWPESWRKLAEWARVEFALNNLRAGITPETTTSAPMTTVPPLREWKATAPRREWKEGKGDRWK